MTKDMHPILVVALGGNALLKRGETPKDSIQRERVREVVDALAPLIRDYRLAITHGNGPQVGLLALQAAALDETDRPFDTLGAQSQGMIGYWLMLQMIDHGGFGSVQALISPVEVAADDPAFASPAKPIGPVYDSDTARIMADRSNWTMMADTGGFRRVVASPLPVGLPGIAVMRNLIACGVTIVTCGGGGVPVARSDNGGWLGVEAVVDKDRTAALLAQELGAAGLLILTDVKAVMENFGTDRERPLREISARQINPADYPPGSMGPKLESAADFVRRTGHPAWIGQLSDAAEIVAGRAGTRIVP
ncbi:MAG: carbamate kinase [Pseudomonadota bacterium]|nr:carbamate kinase [Pseudomonadota bacterium]